MKNQSVLGHRPSGSLSTTRKRPQLPIAALVAMSLLGFSAASAEEAEDSSAAFEAEKESMNATLGVAAAESTVTTHENGMTSAVVGVSALKMLVVRQNADGTLSYGHVSSEKEAEAFAKATDTDKPAEE
ncbi:MAG: hypothetical protein WBN23_05815 [Woeseia sp.]